MTTPTPDANPADTLTPAEIAAAGTMRPIDALPSPIEIVGNPQITAVPSLESFSPEQRQQIMERAGSTNPDTIKAAIHGFLIEKSREFRIVAGAGAGATETERTALSQTNELRLLSAEHGRIEAELAEVTDYRIEVGDDGKPRPTPVPVYRFQGSMRAAKEARMDELRHQMALRAGIEGERELAEAQKADALQLREMKAQVAEQREITRRAHEMAREDRINRAAGQRAKFLTDSNL